MPAAGEIFCYTYKKSLQLDLSYPREIVHGKTIVGLVPAAGEAFCSIYKLLSENPFILYGKLYTEIQVGFVPLQAKFFAPNLNKCIFPMLRKW